MGVIGVVLAVGLWANPVVAATCKKMKCDDLVKYQGNRVVFKGIDIPIPGQVDSFSVGEFEVEAQLLNTPTDEVKTLDALQLRQCEAVNAVRKTPSCVEHVARYLESIEKLQEALLLGPVTPWYRDEDGDGFGDAGVMQTSRDQPPGYVATDTDCNDDMSSVFPGGAEVCDELDNDCDGEVDDDVGSTWYRDADGDGYGLGSDSTEACSPPQGYVADSADCYDKNIEVHPGQAGWFDVHRGDGSFDYDCDQENQVRYVDTGSCGAYPGWCSAITPGWFNTSPQCGESSSWLGDCDFSMKAIGACVREAAPDSKAQLCR